MAFWLFLSLIPLAAVAGLVTAKLAIGGQWLATPLLESLPEATRAVISKELGNVAAWNGGKVGFGAALTFLWLSSSGVHAIFDGIELGAEAPPRSWWRKRALATGACIALSTGAALVALLGTGIGWAWRFVGGSMLLQVLQVESSATGHVLRLVVAAGVSLALVSGLYRVALPAGATDARPVVPGALVAIGLHVVLGFGYRFYVKKAGDAGAYQAGLASIAVTMTALYLFCLVLLIGAKVNEMLGEQRKTVPASRRSSP